MALGAIRGNLTRTVITCLIISIGIMSLVGILTAIDGIESSLVRNFSFMGANSFNIQDRASGFHMGRNQASKVNPVITYRQAKEFKERYQGEGVVSHFAQPSMTAIAKYRSEKTNPNTFLVGGDERYMRVAGYQLLMGRNLSPADLERNNSVAVIGYELWENLFNGENPIDKVIKIGGTRLRVVGVFDTKGSAFDFGGDRLVLLPITVSNHHFPLNGRSCNIGVAVDEVMALNVAVDYSISLFRQIRRLKVKQEDNFSIVKSDSLSKTLMSNLQMIILAAVFIAAITLIGAAVALMNIMLVSVTERTKEIGVRKAIGAKSSTVLNQFVVEAITICQLGGLGGIVLGMIIGNVTSNIIGGEFIIPWNWMILSLAVCTVVGLAAGIWPAYKASKVNPIDALRYE